MQRFAKLPEQFGFAIEHTDSVGNLRYYEPDFVALAADGIHYIVDTKGLEDTSVANKDRAAQLWCENTTRLAGEPLGLPESSANRVQEASGDQV